MVHISLRVILVKKIRAGWPASYLLRTFHKIYQSSSQSKRRRCFHLFLCAAVKHNHANLIRLLLADTGCVLDTVSSSNMRSLFIAIRSGDVELVKIILQLSSSPLNMLKEHPVYPLCEYNIKRSHAKARKKRSLSLVQYACLCDEREVLKLLVTYDIEHEREVENSILPASALLTVIDFLTKASFRRMLTLPAIVQLILDTKSEDNHAQYLYIDKALLLLIFTVTSEERRMLVETARMLLRAGSDLTHDQKRALLYVLLQASYADLSTTYLHEHYRGLMNDLLMLLMTHCAAQMDLLDKHTEFEIILRRTINSMEQSREVATASRTHLCILMDNLANIFNYFLLSFGDDLNKHRILIFDHRLPEGYRTRSLHDCAFVCIAGYSSEQGHSDKYLRVMLSHMSASEIRQLKIRLSKLETFRDYNQTLEYTQAALKVIEAVELPFSLKHLSRRAITRAMSYRCLDAQAVSTLHLPKSMEEYLLPYIDSV